MTATTDMPTPALLAAFTLTASPKPTIDIGRLATGGSRQLREFGPGSLAGDRLNGSLVAGCETLLHRPDGVITVEASYVIRSEAGEVMRMIGTGYSTVDGPFVGTRMTIVIEADEDGPHAWLTTRAFVAQRAASTDTLAIFEII